ncbi:MAG: hypothetical protein ACLUYV_08735 [Alistipes shahii]
MAELGATGYANQWRSQVYSNLRITQQLCNGSVDHRHVLVRHLQLHEQPFHQIAQHLPRHGARRQRQPDLRTDPARHREPAYSLSAKGDRTIYLEAALNYRNTFGRHDVSGMLLFNQSDEINTKATNVEEALPYRFRGLAGRFTYGFDDRYFAEFNFGYNGRRTSPPRTATRFLPRWVWAG